MCNEYEEEARVWKEYEDAMREVGPWGASAVEPNLRNTIMKPSLRGPVVRYGVDGKLELVALRWGMVPRFWTGPTAAWFRRKNEKTGKTFANPFTNARAETVATTAAYKQSYADRRCLIPATGYIEYSGAGTPKPRYRFAVRGEDLFAFAGLWDLARTADGEVESFTMLTSAPGPDAAAYHDREPVILPRDQWVAWLDTSNDMAARFTGCPAGTLTVEAKARPAVAPLA